MEETLARGEEVGLEGDTDAVGTEGRLDDKLCGKRDGVKTTQGETLANEGLKVTGAGIKKKNKRTILRSYT